MFLFYTLIASFIERYFALYYPFGFFTGKLTEINKERSNNQGKRNPKEIHDEHSQGYREKRET